LAESQDVVVRNASYSGRIHHWPDSDLLKHWLAALLAVLLIFAWLQLAGDARVLGDEAALRPAIRTESAQNSGAASVLPAGSPELSKFRLLGVPAMAR
jgi:hypothetical protein